jgi:TM2 domain-containing membrane protein YozV
MSGFGRKGGASAMPLSPGEAMARRAGYVPPAPVAVAEPTPSSELAAFLAAERKRRPETPEPGLTDIAIATPPARRSSGGGGDKSMLLAYVLWWFACAIAAHRFYLGAIGSGFAMLGLFVGSFMVMMLSPPIGLMMLGIWLLWVIGDAFLIPGMVRAANRPDGAAIFA